MIRWTAQRWGVPPWVVAGDQPTPDIVALWATRELVFMRLGVP